MTVYSVQKAAGQRLDESYVYARETGGEVQAERYITFTFALTSEMANPIRRSRTRNNDDGRPWSGSAGQIEGIAFVPRNPATLRSGRFFAIAPRFNAKYVLPLHAAPHRY